MKEIEVSDFKNQDTFYNEEKEKLNLVELKEKFEDALKMLKPNFKLYNYYTNLIVYSEDRNYEILSKFHFIDEINDSEKEKVYKILKDCFVAFNKEQEYKIRKNMLDQSQKVDLFKNNCVRNPISTRVYSEDTPKEIIDFLYELCKDDIKVLEEFSKLVYKIYCNPTENLITVIYAKTNALKAIWDFFALLFGYTCANVNFSFLGSNFNYCTLAINSFVRSYPAYLISYCAPILLEPYLTTFKKLFNGTSFKFKNPFFNDNIIFKNSIPTIYFTDNEEHYKTMKRVFKAKGFCFKNNSLPRLPNDHKIWEWINFQFVYLGYRFFCGEKKGFGLALTSHEIIISNFLNDYCTFDVDATCSKKDLHHAYERYSKKYYYSEILKQRKFCEYVIALKGDILTISRPHKYKSEYLYVFNGVSLNEKYYEEFKEELKDEIDTSDYNKFEKAFNKIIDRIYSTND